MAERVTYLSVLWDDHDRPDPNWGAALRTGGLDVQSVAIVTRQPDDAPHPDATVTP